LTNSVNGFLGDVKERYTRHAKAEAYRRDPALWSEEVAGIKMWSKQREFAYSIRDNRATAVAAGHGVGKTFGAALVCAWWVDVHPVRDVFIASTAPSQPQVALLWDNIRTIKALIEERYEKGLIDHKLPGYITGDNAWKLDDGFKIGEGRKPPDNKSDVAFQGRHAPYLLAIADEAVGVPGGFIDALGNIATGRLNRQLLIANPTDPTCTMAKIWREENPEWVRLHISVMEAPTLTLEEGFDPDAMAERGMAGQEYIDQKKKEYGGVDDPRYIARVLGQWAFDAGNNVFTPEEIAKACNLTVLPDPNGVPEFGLDIARSGKDSSVLYQMFRGEVWESVEDDETGEVELVRTGRMGYYVRKLDEWRKAPLTGNDPTNLGTTQRFHQHALATGARILKFDVSGMGGAVEDGLQDIERKNGGVPYFYFGLFAGSTTDVDTRTYTNARAEQFFAIKKLMIDTVLDIDPEDKELVEELGDLVFENDSKGRVKIESKDDMKKRGVKSPDHADALWYVLMDMSAQFEMLTGRTVIEDEYFQDEYAEVRSGGYYESV
jgi:hypothetical protein